MLLDYLFPSSLIKKIQNQIQTLHKKNLNNMGQKKKNKKKVTQILPPLFAQNLTHLTYIYVSTLKTPI